VGERSEDEEAWLRERRKRATVALTNIIPDSLDVRRYACRAGLQSSMMDMMTSESSEPAMKSVSMACLGNLSIDR
jgi:hypothetical protein